MKRLRLFTGATLAALGAYEGAAVAGAGVPTLSCLWKAWRPSWRLLKPSLLALFVAWLIFHLGGR